MILGHPVKKIFCTLMIFLFVINTVPSRETIVDNKAAILQIEGKIQCQVQIIDPPGLETTKWVIGSSKTLVLELRTFTGCSKIFDLAIGFFKPNTEVKWNTSTFDLSDRETRSTTTQSCYQDVYPKDTLEFTTRLTPERSDLGLKRGNEGTYDLIIYANVMMNETSPIYKFNNTDNPYEITFSDRRPDPLVMLAIVGIIAIIAAAVLFYANKRLSKSEKIIK